MTSSAVDTQEIFKQGIFKGKILLCSGGGTGICRDMTESIVRHGAKAVIVSRKIDKLQKAAEEMSKSAGGEVFAVQADVRKPEDVERAVAEAIKKFGRIDFLINGAAGNFLAPFEKLSYNAIKTVIEIDLLGTINLTKAVLPYLKASKGSIINVSMTLQYRGVPLQSHAGAAKAGIDALTRHWATEFGPSGIRVNGIAPGPIAATEGMKRLLSKQATPRTIPLQRFGELGDVSQSGVFLFSEAANYITGLTVVVDGGHWLTTSSSSYPDNLSKM
ncbi:2,4-dienoyl-CoA reductase [Phascolomyces articulosus]|uniref:2,4-dienoyl-CoA reductase [(3E)-enoyl-CoA-producing] n=1 Tax=Phascolomyces articulosus TaxID=60185 RepID=A0AAD5KBU6_9FUNG|nr:2,4-dienoyl-CoA reductase [Phascolomyces articulosus]